MLFTGEWDPAGHVAPRPTVWIDVVAFGGTLVKERFLLDTGADRTILSAGLLWLLAWPASALQPSQLSFAGIGGSAGFVELTTAIILPRRDGQLFRLHRTFAAFVDDFGLEMSLLGRDILSLFDVIVSQERNEILLLRPLHYYLIAES